MAEEESLNPAPEEIPVRVWDYGWPQGELVDSFAACKKVEGWVRLCATQPEVLSEIGHELGIMTKGDIIPSPDQMEPILKHPLVKDRVLRLCNEIFDSTAGTQLQDPMRALVLLGSLTLRNLAFVVAIYNRFLVEPTPKAILPEIVKSYLTGVYAVLFSRTRKKILNAQEIFLAGSMNNLGRFLFWYFGGEKAQDLHHRLSNEASYKELEEEIFGFYDGDLSYALSKRFLLGETFEKVASRKPHEEENLQLVQLSIRLTRALFEGHGSQNFFEIKRELAKKCELNADEMQEIILEGLERCIEGLSLYDNPDLLEYVPYPKEPEEEAAQEEMTISEFAPEPNLEVVKETIQQLVKIPLSKDPDMNEVMKVTASGLFAGGDFDRVMIAFLDPSRKHAHSKFLHQATPSELHERFEIEVTEDEFFKDVAIDLMKPEGYLLRNILRESKVAWVGNTGELVLRKLRNNAFNKIIGRGQFFIAPIVVKHHKLGFYYCDRQPSHRKLDIKSYDAFMDICLQANKAMELLRKSDDGS